MASWPVIVSTHDRESTHKHKTYRSINIMGHEVSNASPGHLSNIGDFVSTLTQRSLRVTASFTKRIWSGMDYEQESVKYFNQFGTFASITMVACGFDGAEIEFYKNKFTGRTLMPSMADIKKRYGLAEPITPLYFLDVDCRHRGNWHVEAVMRYQRGLTFLFPAAMFHGVDYKGLPETAPSGGLFLEYVFYEGDIGVDRLQALVGKNDG